MTASVCYFYLTEPSTPGVGSTRGRSGSSRFRSSDLLSVIHRRARVRRYTRPHRSALLGLLFPRLRLRSHLLGTRNRARIRFLFQARRRSLRWSRLRASSSSLQSWSPESLRLWDRQRCRPLSDFAERCCYIGTAVTVMLPHRRELLSTWVRCWYSPSFSRSWRRPTPYGELCRRVGLVGNLGDFPRCRCRCRCAERAEVGGNLYNGGNSCECGTYRPCDQCSITGRHAATSGKVGFWMRLLVVAGSAAGLAASAFFLVLGF